MAELSIIIPSVQEYPQNVFTFQNIWCELADEGIDFEILFVDNWCKEIEQQLIAAGKVIVDAATQKRLPAEDKGRAYMQDRAKSLPFLKFLHYDKKLSHWNAKNLAVQNSTGQFLWFVDAHCILSKNSLVNTFKYYRDHYEELNGTLHFPISYMTEKRGLELIYKLVADVEGTGEIHYSFTRYPHAAKHLKPFEVPCMSMCGAMMTRQIYDDMGGWPEALGIYGGGENFMNFTLAVLGMKHWIMPERPLYHFADKRGYHWYHDDWVRNRMVSMFIFGGHEILKRWTLHRKGDRLVLEKLRTQAMERAADHRSLIKGKQKLSIEEWIKKWKVAG
jgi:glycosyltransferase involved in cell wall biosynthesis